MPELLTDDAIEQALGETTGWQRDGRELVRTVELASFPTAIEVVDKVAEVAERADHHPDIDIRWRTLTFRCSTHSAGGLTAADLALAKQINQILDAAPKP
ncbi:MAG TPA: 4a-hydroxytetrahydrobiopterin dehydratase [Pseudonocardiaceae bacterium]|jgi:4a-hydroxytetrahydrobiopterin dehydratase|nr:4a-hydroxytetrahydrobiopterin dehydratase [Pseudonocardiaceae bacterium]